MTTPAERYRVADIERAKRDAANEALTSFERETAAAKLASMQGERTFEATERWTHPDATCPWCERPNRTHIAPDTPRSMAGGSKVPTPYELGASLCPVVRDLSTAGQGPWERLYRPPTEAEARAWRESNKAATAVRKPSEAERDAEVRERRARQGKLGGV